MIKLSSFSLLFLIVLGGCGGGDGEAIILAEAEAVFDQASSDNSNQSCSPDCALSAADVERDHRAGGSRGRALASWSNHFCV